MPDQPAEKAFLPKYALGDMVAALRGDGFTIIAPVRVMDAIELRPISSADQIARGLRDEQDGGRYRLHDGEPDMLFDSVVGASSAKDYFFPSRLKLFSLSPTEAGFELHDSPPAVPSYAFIGIRACDVAAIVVQDRVFGLGDPQTTRCESDNYYRQAREQSLLVAVNCTRPGGTCFCASWGTGPRTRAGFDLAMTELKSGFVVTVGSDRGRQLLARLPARPATPAEIELEELKLRFAAEHMGRQLDVVGVKDDLERAIEHPHWDQVAERCLSCGNCAMVCPTCFCSIVLEHTELDNPLTSRVRELEPCYTLRFTYLHGAGATRNTIRGRYRHWLRHKVSTWWDQFGCSGCIGCGRCITWCPVGIDLTAEIPALRGPQPAAHRQSELIAGKAGRP